MPLYLYCIRPAGTSALSHHQGIDGCAVVRVIPHGAVEAVVCDVNIDTFGSEEIARRARDDAQWIVDHAQRHDAVIQSAMEVESGDERGVEPVIPMKFGTLFASEERLRVVMEQDADRFSSLLRALDGHQEWGVKVYVNDAAYRAAVIERDPRLRAAREHAQSLPKGADYFGDMEVSAAASPEIITALEEDTVFFHDALTASAARSERSNVLDRVLAGRKEPMVCNAAYLVPSDQVQVFRQHVEALRRAHPHFVFDCSGPWPPYNFV
jgi:hypothetical protein